MNNVVDMDIIWMYYAIALISGFNKSKKIVEDVLVGSVLVYKGRLVGYGCNSSVRYNDPSAHAEIMALRMGSKILGNYRLLNTVLYVTLEPCMMCLGAMIHARVCRLVCGAKDKKIGWMNLVCFHQILNHPMINHRLFIKTGVLEKICAMKIRDFFKSRR